MKQGIILAAGLGSRLKEITTTIPKSLIPINGKPILERNIEYMIDANFNRIVLVVGYMWEKFEYLKEKYKDFIQIILVFNPKYRKYNTLSSMYYASPYFDIDSYVVMADLYLMKNIYENYYSDNSFYLHMPVENLEKPEWIASLDENNCIMSVDKNGYSGSSYMGVSYWKISDLKFIKSRLEKVDWLAPGVDKMYWDELWFPEFKNRPIHVKHFSSQNDIYEIDDIKDLKKLEAATRENIEES